MNVDVPPNNGDGGEGLQNGRGAHVKFYPYERNGGGGGGGAEKVSAMLKGGGEGGGHRTFGVVFIW